MSSSSAGSILPLVARRANSSDAVVSIGQVDDLLDHYTEYGPPHPLPISTDFTNSIILDALQRLTIILGRDIHPSHKQVLKAVLKGTTRDHTTLESVCILAYSSSFTSEWSELVRESMLAPSVVLYSERIVNSVRNSEALIDWRYFGSDYPGTSSWEPTSSLMLPLDYIGDYADVVRQLPQLERLYLAPVDRSSPPRDHHEMIKDFEQLLVQLRELYTVSFPLHLSSYLLPILKDSHHRAFAVEIRAFPAIDTSKALHPGLIAEFHDFHRLQRLSIPSEVLSAPLLNCLGDLRSLHEQTIIVNGPVPVVAPTRACDKFKSLRSLILLGLRAFQSDTESILRAFACASPGTLETIKLNADKLSYQKEMGRTLRVISKHWPHILELDICIEGTTDGEQSDWMDLSLLRNFKLRVFNIKHPRPISVPDIFIRDVLKAWPLAESVSFNPRPTLPRASSSHTAQSPTLDSLKYAALYGSKLRHFGIHLESRPQHTLWRLETLDLGMADVEKALWEPLFPNAIQV